MLGDLHPAQLCGAVPRMGLAKDMLTTAILFSINSARQWNLSRGDALRPQHGAMDRWSHRVFGLSRSIRSRAGAGGRSRRLTDENALHTSQRPELEAPLQSDPRTSISVLVPFPQIERCMCRDPGYGGKKPPPRSEGTPLRQKPNCSHLIGWPKWRAGTINLNKCHFESTPDTRPSGIRNVRLV